MHYFGVKTLSETPCSPPLMQPGYGARRSVFFFVVSPPFERSILMCILLNSVVLASRQFPEPEGNAYERPASATELMTCATLG